MIPESGCGVGVISIFFIRTEWEWAPVMPEVLPAGIWMGFCPGIWMGFCPGIWMGFCPGIWMGFCPGIWMGFCPGIWMGFCPDIWMGFCLGIWMGFCPGIWMRFCPGTWMGHRSGYGVLPDGGTGILLASMCFAHTWMEHLPHAGANTHPDAHRDAWAKPHPCAQAKPWISMSMCPGKPHPCARTKPHPGQEPILILPGQLPGQNIEVTPMPHPLHAHFLVSPHPLSLLPWHLPGHMPGQMPGTFLKVFDGNTLPILGYPGVLGGVGF